MKKTLALILAAVMLFAATACGSTAAPAAPAVTEAPAPTEASAPTEAPAEETPAPEKEALRLFVLAGPTGIGALPLADAAGRGETANDYTVTITGANDEIVAAVSKGEADIAAVATNLAATLYNKTQGGVRVLAVNTLGVLSLLSSGEEFSAVADLQGKTIYAPGQGANPEYILRYVLSGNGLDPDADVNIVFVAEGSELLQVWATDPEAVILAPQPVATTILMQNEGSRRVFDMTEEWNAVAGGDSTLMMGCVIVRTAYLEEHPEAVAAFLEEYEASVKQAAEDVEGTAALCEQYGIIPKAALAKKAIPACGLQFVAGEALRTQLGGYLQVMFDFNPKSVGGSLPGDDFYYGA